MLTWTETVDGTSPFDFLVSPSSPPYGLPPPPDLFTAAVFCLGFAAVTRE